MRPMQRVIAAIALGSLPVGCIAGAPGDDEDENVTRAHHAVLSNNALTENGARVFNGYANNGLANNGLGFGADIVGELCRASPVACRYALECALAVDQCMDVEGTTICGEIGGAPNWYDSGMSEVEKLAVSSCMCARMNKYGNSVPISLYHPGYLHDEPDPGYDHLEGAFACNLFEDPPWGVSYVGFEPEYARDTWGRVCTLEDCGFMAARGEDAGYAPWYAAWVHLR